MRYQAKEKALKPGQTVYYIDENFKLWIWPIKKVNDDDTATVEVIDQHIKADKTPQIQTVALRLLKLN